MRRVAHLVRQAVAPAASFVLLSLSTATRAEDAHADSPVTPARKPKAAAKEVFPMQQQAPRRQLGDIAVFSGSSNEPLAQEVAYELQVPLGKILHQRFPDGEITLQVQESVRGKDVFIIQSTAKPVNENLMELLLVISTMRRASAKSITAVVPYFGYKRDVGNPSGGAYVPNQVVHDNAAAAAGAGPFGGASLAAALGSSPLLPSSETGTVSSVSVAGDYDLSHTARSAFPVSAADVCVMMQVMGVDRVITVDLHLPGTGATEVRRLTYLNPCRSNAAACPACRLPPSLALPRCSRLPACRAFSRQTSPLRTYAPPRLRSNTLPSSSRGWCARSWWRPMRAASSWPLISSWASRSA